ncbi:hypothetical protein A3E76_01460 [Candidatus Saccharibacteria bacterium RIFCSPHIGHO2_12_FULL_44_22]|jgi:hypothetical protein|nr:MAG: hypothetical protein A3E76_01460 [Candidatus Saccharibacteria bacterium RIFCSPHIGHO2_12_FULL_44_22]
MSSDNQLASAVGGTVMASAGVTMLPHTSNNTATVIISIALITLGLIVLGSFIAMKIVTRLK